MQKGKLFLIPTPIAQWESSSLHLPEYNKEIIDSLDYFVVENTRTARRFISSLKLSKKIDSLEFVELNEHSDGREVEAMLEPMLNGVSCGLMSEAGVPAVADPGADLVALAHIKNIEIVPLVGPSSIIISLMCSGMNGQSFAFHGYLPIKAAEKRAKIKELERGVTARNQTQIFIEAPYRSDKLFLDLLSELSPSVRLCVAANLTAPNQIIKTMKVSQWKKVSVPDIKKIPTIFLIG
ncbi:MAG: SAM-dependent methyltransferase [Rikenellaceae bacterium]